MKYPPSLMPLSILFWGWLTESWAAASIMLIMTTAHVITDWRMRISIKQFQRIGDFTTVLIVATLIYFYIVQFSARPIFIVIKWLPIFFTPLLFTQLFSTRETLPYGALFYSMRNRPEYQELGIDFRLPFAGICLLAAGAANDRTPLYFIASIIFISWILWVIKPKHGSTTVWLLLIAFASTSAFWGHQVLYRFQAVLEEKAIDWLSDWMTDPFKNRTSIGDIGGLKLSGRIEFRVRSAAPVLLHEASYDRYAGKNWYASKLRFQTKEFHNRPRSAQTYQLEILQLFDRQAVLPLPAGTVRIEGLEGADISANELGAVKIDNAPQFADYRVFYTGKQASEPTKYDLDIPEQHLEWLEKIGRNLKLKHLPPKSAAQTIKRFFRNQYAYSLYLGEQGDADLALQDFMLNRKAGHCEYFAVASVFLLRYAGIPARLATGYSVQEYDSYEQLYLVRRRHAHAWAIASIGGYWIDVDSTPSQWLALEEENADRLQPFYDRISKLVFEFKRWRWLQKEKESDTEILIAASFVLLIYLIWRLYRNRSQMVRKKIGNRQSTPHRSLQGMDSEFYLIEKALQETELSRRDNEGLQQWIERFPDAGLNKLLKMHYRYRFDPLGITSEQRQELRQAAENWIGNRRKS